MGRILTIKVLILAQNCIESIYIYIQSTYKTPVSPVSPVYLPDTTRVNSVPSLPTRHHKCPQSTYKTPPVSPVYLQDTNVPCLPTRHQSPLCPRSSYKTPSVSPASPVYLQDTTCVLGLLTKHRPWPLCSQSTYKTPSVCPQSTYKTPPVSSVSPVYLQDTSGTYVSIGSLVSILIT